MALIHSSLSPRLSTLIPVAAVAAISFLAGAAPAAQQPPPIQGVTGTIATDATIEEVHEGAHGILSKAGRLFRIKRHDNVESGGEGDEETLAGLKRGTAVVLRPTTAADNLAPAEIDRLEQDGLTPLEAIITTVNRRDKTIAIRLTDGSHQTLRLTDRAAASIDKNGDRTTDTTGRVLVFVKDEAGQRVVHYFKRIS